LGRIDFGFAFFDFIRAHTNWTAGAHRAPAFLFSGCRAAQFVDLCAIFCSYFHLFQDDMGFPLTSAAGGANLCKFPQKSWEKLTRQNP
jgi:hypothetical protein